jgi:hypothetical protein
MVVLPPGFFHDILPPGWVECGELRGADLKV